MIAAVDGPFTSTTPSTASATSSTSNSPALNSSPAEFSEGAKVGVGTGVGVVALAGILGLGFWLMRRREGLGADREIVYEKDGERDTKLVELQTWRTPMELAA
jgi:hypothetical protein